MGTVGQDLRYAWRQLRKHPGFAVLAIFTMALGIVANSTIFTWIHSTLFNPVPGVTRTGDMVTLRRGESISPPLSYDDYADLRDRTRTLTGLLAYHDDSMSITGSSTPERIYGALASSNYFQVLGVQPVLGRTFLPAQTNERAGAAEAVIGYDLWQRRFAGDPAILGKTIQINLHPYTIVGVAPRGFVGCKTGLRTELWIPLGMDRQVFGWPRVNDRSVTWLNALGTLAPGVDRRQADKELNLLMQRIAGRYPLSHQGENRLATDPLWRSPFGVNVYLFGTLPILEALAALLLLLACANVANLLLVRSVARRRELAIRLSMGAGHWRVVRQLLTENLALALAGGAAALALTLWTSRSLGLFVTASPLPITLDGEVDRAVLLATVAVSIFTAVLSGLLPALRATALAPAEVLKEESLGSTGGIAKSRLSGSLVILQVALSLLLLVCAGLFVRSLRHAQSIDPGFDPSNMLLASVDLGPAGYSAPAGMEMERQILDRVSGLQGVQSATLADFSPLNFTIHSESASSPEGYVPASHESLEVDRGIVGPGYLKTLRTPLIA
ncbi:MAG TPA: ABC transporter permease, partial [Acidobacteriaceae bacterium]|nr:ABC transporter permease [Acidobacteriaceae bacterium]